MAWTSRVSPRAAPASRSAEAGNRAVLETQLGSKPELGVFPFVERVAIRADEGQVGGDQVADFRVAFLFGNDGSIRFQESVQRVVDVFFGQLHNRSFDCEPLVIGQVELRANVDFQLEAHRPDFGDLDRVEIEARLKDGFELEFLVDLVERREQQARLDLLRDLLPESLDDQLPRCAARPKSGTRVSFRSDSSDSSN